LRKPLEKRLQIVEAKMSDLQKEQSSFEQTLADASIYETDRKEALKSLIEQQVQCKGMLDALESEWLQLQEALEQLQ
jgi:ATP-binding cassette subfamily F protein 3